MSPRRSILLALVVALLQVGFLGWIIASRAAVLRNGPEALLKVEPVDPRDLLRGDYVRLGYEISRIPASLVADLPSAGSPLHEGPILLRIGKDADGYWRARSASLGEPATPPAADELDIRGTVSSLHAVEAGSTLWVTYGIERYYVPEGEGLAIEKDMRVRNFGIVVALAGDGTPQIKALMDGTSRVYEEPPY